ncbi:hypothetical protein BC332_32295 [Capsicum chinense]|nr:hypothetical protein BC332_32295 [Capsicum chinense]
MNSVNPYEDFKKSMEEMLKANQQTKEYEKCLEELLIWYLKSNGNRYIIDAFFDLLNGYTSSTNTTSCSHSFTYSPFFGSTPSVSASPSFLSLLEAEDEIVNELQQQEGSRSYLYIVNTINPGSFTRLHKMEDNHFLYAFVALSTSIRGWRYCMPTIVFDGTFLKSAYKGTMLSASVLVAAGHILPLAYAVVDSENDASWEWIFCMLNTTFGEREGMCIVSDRHDNILKAAALVYPNMVHCICIYHLWNNIKGRFKKNQKQLKGILFTMARTYIKEDFDRLMEDMNKINNKVKEYLFDIGYDKWSIAYAHVNRSMFMTSNIAESVNSANRDARDMLIKKFL